MNLLIVSHFYDAHGGGIEQVAAQLARALSRAGHLVEWAASDAEPVPDDVGTVPLRCRDLTERLTGLPMPIPGWPAMFKLARAVRSSDAVIINDALYVTSILAMLFAKASGKPVILIQHIAGIPFASRILRGLMRLANTVVTRPMLAVADHLVFISDVVRREMIGEPARRSFKLLFNGVDATIFHSELAPDSIPIAGGFRSPTSAKLAVFVGRFVEKKGLAVLRRLAEIRPDLAFVLVGDGPIRPDRWNLANVHVLGRQPQDSIAAIFRAADLLILPSVGEGFPLVIQEAMACGLSVVCGDGSAGADPDAAIFLQGVEIDLTDPEGSAAHCSEALDVVLAGRVDRCEMSTYATTSYSWDKMAAGLLDCLSARTDPLRRTAGRPERL